MSESAHLHPDLEALVGATLHDRYRVDSLLGVGGMGAVFKACHTGLDRDVAIKVLHPEIGRDASVSKRFDREATSASRLDHPNCVRVTDFGTTEAGTKYLVMELLEGTELEARLGRPWAPAATIETAKQILSGLEHAHHFGIVHRDLKPENVFITTDFRGEEIAKLVDFGIAKLLDERGTEKLTRQGIVFGTPRYMSPEQAAGGKVDARTDLYAAGLIFYEMLAGRPPFTADDPAQLLRMQIMEEPPPLPDAVPRPLANVVQKLLEKSKMDRFASARETIEALDAASSLIAAAPISEPPTHRSGAAWQPAPAPASVRSGATISTGSAGASSAAGVRRTVALRTGSHAGIGQPATGAFESLPASASEHPGTASHPATSPTTQLQQPSGAGEGVSVTAPIVVVSAPRAEPRPREWAPFAAAGVALLMIFAAVGVGMTLISGDEPRSEQNADAAASAPEHLAVASSQPVAGPIEDEADLAGSANDPPAPGPTRPATLGPGRSPATTPSGSPQPRDKAADADDAPAPPHEKSTDPKSIPKPAPTPAPVDGTQPADERADEPTNTVTDVDADTAADRDRKQAEDEAKRREHEAAKRSKKASKAKGKAKDK
ncbi:serine/threonine protein kinase [Enhygromyxa salina]|uniref:non-specific serine/threonine protein kinase n=1 Tax=Enhygromyxa salina TaxID=215803 RepID=A0A0C2D3V5_9BACT|nr:serine/threonine-protein kinase [Enhygromyxa salina]KIG14787.1 serine/threonine protein kinase [Enhygromyxa salina]